MLNEYSAILSVEDVMEILGIGKNKCFNFFSSLSSSFWISPSKIDTIVVPVPRTFLEYSSLCNASTFFHPPTGTQWISLLDLNL